MTDQDLLINNDDEMEEKINEIMKKVNISIKGVNLFNISFTDENPAIAKMVVQSLLNIFYGREPWSEQERFDLSRKVY